MRKKKKKKRNDNARIPLDVEANGLESKYRLAASPFPAIATKKEETSGGGLRFLDCRQKSVRACCKDVAQA